MPFVIEYEYLGVHYRTDDTKILSLEIIELFTEISTNKVLLKSE